VQTRGGPEPSMLTSWVQIMAARVDDGGTFICIAANVHGEVKAVAEISVENVL